MNGDSFSISEALRFGWDAFKRNIGTAVVLAFASVATMFLLNGVTQAAQSHGTLSFGLTLLAQLAQMLLAFLWIRFALAVHDGQPIRLSQLWPARDSTFLNYLGVSILYGLLVTVGLILFVVPGLYLAVRYGLAGFLVADGKAPDVLGAFRESAELTRGRRWRLFLFGLVLVLLDVAGAALLGVGLLATLPVTALAGAFVYRRLVAAHPAPGSFLAGPPAPLAV